jgi:hypothetical protein
MLVLSAVGLWSLAGSELVFVYATVTSQNGDGDGGDGNGDCITLLLP